MLARIRLQENREFKESSVARAMHVQAGSDNMLWQACCQDKLCALPLGCRGGKCILNCRRHCALHDLDSYLVGVGTRPKGMPQPLAGRRAADICSTREAQHSEHHASNGGDSSFHACQQAAL
jgi:hypothetical protein